MVLSAVKEKTKLVTLPENYLRIDDPEWEAYDKSLPYWDINLQTRSWAWCFINYRGSGKTTSCTWWGCHEMALNNMRVVSNYPIEFIFLRDNGRLYPLRSEPLDLYKLMVKDNQYQHCLIIIDEAADIISHLASQTWKNRLMNVFTRAIRHGHNNLFMTAQNFEEIDKGMRRQTDIIVQCDDLPTKLGRHDYPQGSLIEMTFLDNNGSWTSHPYEEQLKYNLRHGIYEDIGEHYHLFPTRMWGDDEHKPVYDSWIQFDVFETLKRVDIELSSQKLVDPKKEDLGRLYIEKAMPVVETILKQATSELPAIETKEFYAQIGALTTKEKDALAKLLNSCDVRVGVDSRGKRYYDFTRFKFDKFRDGGAHD